jgi:hypothetical protein
VFDAPDAHQPCVYVPRRPEDTVFYAIVRKHLEPFLLHGSDDYQKPLPRYVVAELCLVPSAGAALERSPEP